MILLNNDTTVERHFVTRLTEAVSRKPYYFSVSAKMVSMADRDIIDDAGDYYCAFGWAFARGKGKRRRAIAGPVIYLPPVEERQSTEEIYFWSWDCSMKPILLIWRILMSVGGHVSGDTETGLNRKQ